MYLPRHYDDVIMSAIASQITSLTIVYSTVYPGADQSKHQSSASLAFVWGIHRGPVNSPHKWPVTRKRFSFDDVIMIWMILRSFDDLREKNYIPLGPNNAVYGDLFVTGLRNGLLSDGTKPSFESRLIPCHESRKRKPSMNIYQ